MTNQQPNQTTKTCTTRLLAIDNVDLLDQFRLWRGRDYCDDQADQRDCLVTLPAAIGLAEKSTGRSINRKLYEMSGTGNLPCISRLAHPPINEVICVELRGDDNEWFQLLSIDDPASTTHPRWEFLPSLEGEATVRLCTDGKCCECKCVCKSPCSCPKDRWRIRYTTGANDCPLPINPTLQMLINLLADQFDDHDAAKQKTIDRLIAACKPHALS